jgi:hypothetical protein
VDVKETGYDGVNWIRVGPMAVTVCCEEGGDTFLSVKGNISTTISLSNRTLKDLVNNQQPCFCLTLVRFLEVFVNNGRKLVSDTYGFFSSL